MSDRQPFNQDLYDAVMASPSAPSEGAMVARLAYAMGARVAARIAAERAPVAVSDEAGYRPDARGRRGSDSTLWCASPFGEDDCAAWFQDSRRSSFRGAIMHGWTRDKQHLWLCPECSQRVFDLRVSRAIRSALPPVPQLPEGWFILSAWDHPKIRSEVWIGKWEQNDTTSHHTKGTGPTFIDALNAAIAAAKEAGE